MSLNFVANPYSYYNNRNKTGPLFNGFIYVGIPDLDPTILANQKQVTAKQEDGTQVPIAQPIRTNSGGYAVDSAGNPVVLLVDGNYSIRVNDRLGRLALEQADVNEWVPITIDDNPVLSVDNIADLRDFEPSLEGQQIELLGHTLPGIGGGPFYFDESDTTSADNNGTVIVTATNKRWKRPLSPYIDASEFGAIDDSGTTNNNFIISSALTAASELGIGTVTVTSTSSNGFFGLEQINGTSAIKLVSNVNLITTTNAKLKPIIDSTDFMVASIFLPGNFHPDFWRNAPKEGVTLTEGSNLISVSDSSIYPLNTLVEVTSQTFYGATFPIYTYMEMFKVVEVVSATQIKLSSNIKYPGAGYLTPTNTNTSGRFGYDLFALNNVVVSGFEVETSGFMVGDSATFNCEFRSLTGKAKAVMYGNTYCHTKWRDINIQASNIFSELSFGSHDNDAERITMSISNSGLFGNTGVSWQESGRNNRCKDFKMYIDGNGVSNPIKIQDHINSYWSDGDIYIPSNDNTVLSITDSGTTNRRNTEGSGFDNIRIHSSDGAPVICDIDGQSATAGIKQCFFDNIKYYGAKPTVAGLRLRGHPSSILRGVRADIYSDGELIASSLSNTEGNDLTLRGDWSISGLEDLATNNSLKLISNDRGSLRSSQSVSTASTVISSTSLNNIVKTITIPKGTFNRSDRFSLRLTGATSGLGGNKNIEVGFNDSGSVFRDIPLVITGQSDFFIDCEFLVRANVGQIQATTWSGEASGVEGAKVTAAILDPSTNDIVIQFRSWVDVGGDLVTLNSIEARLIELPI